MQPECLEQAFAAVKLKIPGLIALSLAVLALLSFQIPVLRDSQLDVAVRNAAHAPLFGLLTYMWLSLLRPGGIALRRIILVLLLLAVAAEFLEGLVYNGWSIIDLSGNLLGVLLGFTVWRLFDPGASSGRVRNLFVVGTVLSITILSPVAFALHRIAEQNRWYPILVDPRMQSARPEVVTLVSDRQTDFIWTDTGLELHLFGSGIRGIALTQFAPDWTGNTNLTLDVENPSPTRFRFEMHIRDAESTAQWEDRFNYERFLQPETRTKIRIPLQDIGNAPSERTIDLSRIAVIAIYSGAESSDSIILRSIALE